MTAPMSMLGRYRADASLLYSMLLRNLPWEPFTWLYVPDLIMAR